MAYSQTQATTESSIDKKGDVVTCTIYIKREWYKCEKFATKSPGIPGKNRLPAGPRRV